MKTCNKCLIPKSVDNFRVAKAYKDKLFCWCKSCEKEYHISNKIQHKKYVKKYAEANKERKKITQKLLIESYKISNKPEIDNKICSNCNESKLSKEFNKCSTNKDGLTYYCKSCIKVQQKNNYIKHKDVILSKSRTYALKRKQRTPKWANIDKINEFYRNRPSGYHVDHIIPLNGENVCGLHIETNLQYLPAQENLSKGNKVK